MRFGETGITKVRPAVRKVVELLLQVIGAALAIAEGSLKIQGVARLAPDEANHRGVGAHQRAREVAVEVVRLQVQDVEQAELDLVLFTREQRRDQALLRSRGVFARTRTRVAWLSRPA